MRLRTTAFEPSRCRQERCIQRRLTSLAQGCSLTVVGPCVTGHRSAKGRTGPTAGSKPAGRGPSQGGNRTTPQGPANARPDSPSARYPIQTYQLQARLVLQRYGPATDFSQLDLMIGKSMAIGPFHGLGHRAQHPGMPDARWPRL